MTRPHHLAPAQHAQPSGGSCTWLLAAAAYPCTHALRSRRPHRTEATPVLAPNQTTNAPARPFRRPDGPPSMAVNPLTRPATFFGASPHFGFTKRNELLHGRLAMLGFLAAVVNEAATGLGPVGQVHGRGDGAGRARGLRGQLPRVWPGLTPRSPPALASHTYTHNTPPVMLTSLSPPRRPPAHHHRGVRFFSVPGCLPLPY